MQLDKTTMMDVLAEEPDFKGALNFSESGDAGAAASCGLPKATEVLSCPCT